MVKHSSRRKYFRYCNDKIYEKKTEREREVYNPIIPYDNMIHWEMALNGKAPID